jgi:uncharacterized membrane protein YfcA
MMVFANVLGSVVNKVIAQGVIMVILIVSIFVGLLVNIRNVRIKYREENREIQKKSKKNKYEPVLEKNENTEKENKEGIMNEEGETQNFDKLENSKDKKYNIDEDFTLNDTAHVLELNEVKNIKFYEGKNFNPKKISIFSLTIVLTIFYSLMKGTTSIDSIFHIGVCDWEQLLIFFILIICIIVIQIISIRIVKREQFLKLKYNLHKDHEVKFTNGKIAFLIVFALTVGFLANLLGMGGGFVIFPMLIMIGVSPLVASATTIYIIFLAKIVAALLASFSQYLLADYTFTECFLVVIAVIFFSKISDFLLKK